MRKKGFRSSIYLFRNINVLISFKTNSPVCLNVFECGDWSKKTDNLNLNYDMMQ